MWQRQKKKKTKKKETKKKKTKKKKEEEEEEREEEEEQQQQRHYNKGKREKKNCSGQRSTLRHHPQFLAAASCLPSAGKCPDDREKNAPICEQCRIQCHRIRRWQCKVHWCMDGLSQLKRDRSPDHCWVAQTIRPSFDSLLLVAVCPKILPPRGASLCSGKMLILLPRILRWVLLVSKFVFTTIRGGIILNHKHACRV